MVLPPLFQVPLVLSHDRTYFLSAPNFPRKVAVTLLVGVVLFSGRRRWEWFELWPESRVISPAALWDGFIIAVTL
jgi:hypothetical protein